MGHTEGPPTPLKLETRLMGARSHCQAQKVPVAQGTVKHFNGFWIKYFLLDFDFGLNWNFGLNFVKYYFYF